MLAGVAVAIAATCALPMVAVLLAALVGGTDTVRHLIDTVLLGYAGTTLLLVAMVATGTFALGVGTAWLVTMTRFPGARMLEIALVLPLAFPPMCWPMPTRISLTTPESCKRCCVTSRAGVRATTGSRKSGPLGARP